MNEPTKVAQQAPFFKSILEYVELFVLCLSAILLLFSSGLRLCVVSGASMMPTLKDGQLVVTSNVFYQPKTGDVVVFHSTSDTVDRFNEPMIKRVIATQGQTVVIDFANKSVTVDGQTLDEDYIQLIYNGEYSLFAEHHMQYLPSSDGAAYRPVFSATVPEGTMFVMGDNRNDSSDSRTSAIGFVDTRRILGKVVLRLTPLEAFGPVT